MHFLIWKTNENHPNLWWPYLFHHQGTYLKKTKAHSYIASKLVNYTVEPPRGPRPFGWKSSAKHLRFHFRRCCMRNEIGIERQTQHCGHIKTHQRLLAVFFALQVVFIRPFCWWYIFLQAFLRQKRNKKTGFKERANQNDVEQKAEVEHIGQKLRRGSWSVYTSHTSRTWQAAKPFWTSVFFANVQPLDHVAMSTHTTLGSFNRCFGERPQFGSTPTTMFHATELMGYMKLIQGELIPLHDATNVSNESLWRW